MPKKIRIDISDIHHFFTLPGNIERPQQIELRKQAIYQFRNQLLSVQLSQNIENIDFEKTEFGKPFLKKIPKFFLNHSHSQKVYALASSNQVVDLGVDLEDLDRRVRFDALAKHAFHPTEYQMWQALECDPIYWFKVWTTKEAVLKANGLGIRMDLKDLNTNAHPLQNGGRCEHEKIGVFAYQNFELANCMLTVAWRSEHSCRGFALPSIQIHQHGSFAKTKAL